MKYFRKIEGERLYLSPVNLEDVLLYCKWLNDPSITDGINKSKDVITTANEIEYLTEVSKKGQYQFAIVNSKDDTLMGNCGFKCISWSCLKLIANDFFLRTKVMSWQTHYVPTYIMVTTFID